jgi:hypothetical protein
MATLSRHGGLVFMLGTLASCLDDTVEIPVPEPGRPYCMMVVDSLGHFADGSQRLIDWPTRSAAGCACLLPSERNDPTPDYPYLWTEEARNKLNALALEDCEKAALQWDFVWNECQADYESEVWIQSTQYVGKDGDWSNYLTPDLNCADDLSSDDWE